jgi:hypothetical protein
MQYGHERRRFNHFDVVWPGTVGIVNQILT